MSDFSDKCKELLKERELTVYGFSAAHNLDRTTLQRMVTGKKLPSKAFVYKFCQGLHIPTSEQEDLIELYDLEFYGKNTIIQRRLVKELLENISHIETMTMSGDKGISQAKENMIHIEPLQTNNRLEIQQLIFNLIQHETCQENSVIYTNLSPIYHTFFEHLMLIASEDSKKLKIYHTFNILKTNSDSGDFSYNMEIFKMVIPFALNTFCQYEAYYHYVYDTEKALSNILYPYYIIGSHFILWISTDFSSAYLQNNPTEIEFHRKRFLESLDCYIPLFTHLSDPQKAMTHYVKCITTMGTPDYSLEAQPCITYMMPENFWEKFFPKGEFFTSELEALTLSCRDFILKNPVKKALYHTLDGVRNFASNGRLIGDVALFTKTFSIAERICMFETLCQNIRNGINSYIVTPKKLIFPQTTHIDCFGDRGILFYNFNRIDNLCYFFINEATFSSAFNDFVSVFEENGYALNKEDTLAKLEEMISDLKDRLNEESCKE